MSTGFKVTEEETREFTVWPGAVHLVGEFPFVSEQHSNGGQSLTVIIDAGARVGGTSITPSIEEFDLSRNAFVATPILAGAPITAAGRTKLTISPHVASVANVSLLGAAPKRWRLRITQEGGITSQDVGASVRYF